MGSRRSKHNKGVKPIYKEHRLTAHELIAEGGNNWGWFNNHVTWSDDDCQKLVTLCNENAPVEISANVLRRPPTNVAHHARALGLSLPTEWSKLITKRIRKLREEGITLCYPYLKKARPEHADLLEVVNMIPRNIHESMRGDICQEMFLAIAEGRVTLDEIRLRADANDTRFFIKKFYKDNFEMSGRAMSLTDAEGGDDRSYDEIASSLAARDWHDGQLMERQRFIQSFRPLNFPTQLEEVWESQVRDTQYALHERGLNYDFEDVASLLEAGDVVAAGRRPKHERPVGEFNLWDADAAKQWLENERHSKMSSI